jgi:enoyl-CoA hydratase/3-hydroxyacyl-CoA dehydrogenase
MVNKVQEVNDHFQHVAGEASKIGFYKYDNRRKANPDPEIAKYIQKSREIAGVTPDPAVIMF